MINNFSKLTLMSSLLLASLVTNAGASRTLFKCQIEGDAISQRINYVTKYKELDLAFIKDGDKVEAMNVILRGQRTSKIEVPAGAPQGNPGDAMSLMISEKDFRGNLEQENPESGVKNSFDKGARPPIYNSYSISPAGGAVGLSGAVQPAETKYELQTIVANTEEILTYDHGYELVQRQFEIGEVIAENNERFARNELLNEQYAESMTQYNEDLRDAAMTAILTGKPEVKIYPPNKPHLESALPLPQSPLDISYTYREYATERNQPKTTLNVVLNSSQIANLDCVQTQNIVDNKRDVQDLKGRYNNDPRAKALGMASVTINRQHREPWCLQRTVEGTINLAEFNKGKFKVKCEFSGNR